MSTYILLDLSNVFFRSRHVVKGDLDTKVGMAMHITLTSIQKAWRDFNADHTVVCLEGRSWRKDYYTPYKRNRANARKAMTQKEEEEDQAFWEIYEEFTDFLKEKTNCTVLHDSKLEADDLIAGWTQNHPNDKHVIISTDGDFAQLIAPNVKQYNGVNNTITTHEGVYDEKWNPVVDNKTKQEKPAPDTGWLIFEKCIRGDTSDNVFSAYPGARKKGTKNKVGMIDAYNDINNKGYHWNNFMLQRWTDADGEEHRVFDDYQRNVVLCDLSQQPPEIRKIIDQKTQEVEPKKVQQVGMRLIKFCGKWGLNKITESAENFSKPLSARYPYEN